MSKEFLSVMRAFHAPHNREEYLATAYLGNPPEEDADGELPAELESMLPEEFQRKALDIPGSDEVQ
jgi:hypothetical protein